MSSRRSLLAGATAFAVTAALVAGATTAAAPAEAASTFTQADLTRSVDAYLRDFRFDGGQYRQNDQPSPDAALHFWEASFVRQTLVDASRLTGKWRTEVVQDYYRFERNQDRAVGDNPHSWLASDSDWNDDYAWATQYALDAYELTGDRHMLEQARWHTDFFYRDWYDSEYGGGFWRERLSEADKEKRGQKDVPSNGFAITAAELARYYPTATVHNNRLNVDRTYLQIAQDTYAWMRTSFLQPDGGVLNSFSKGHLFWDENHYSYNAGVFLELAANLYDLTKDPQYLQDGRRVADFARTWFTTGSDQLLGNEDDVDHHPQPTDALGDAEIVFKGIFLRGLTAFVTLGHQTQYTGWISDNAQASWANRTDDVPSGVFGQQVPKTRGTGPATGLAAMVATLQVQARPTVLQGEDGRHWGTSHNEDASAASGGALVGSLDKPGNAVEFRNVRSASSLTFRTASQNQGSKLSVYVNGRDVRDVALPTTGSWNAAFATTTVPVAVPADATLRIQYDTGDVAANIDTITLSGSTAGVTFSDDQDHAGLTRTLTKGTYTATQLRAAGFPTGIMTSLRVPSGFRVEVFASTDLTGTPWVHTADSANVGPAENDRMTSVRIS